jgi:ankyrin repeat protein
MIAKQLLILFAIANRLVFTPYSQSIRDERFMSEDSVIAYNLDPLYGDFYDAVSSGDQAKCRELLEKSPPFVDVPKAINMFLARVCSNGMTDTALQLIDRGADVNFVYQNSTILESTIHRGRLEAVRLLLEKGADPNRTRCLVSTVNGSTVGEHREAILKLLLEKGANPNIVFAMFGDKSNARTVLDFASSDSPVRKILLEHGAKTAAEILKENPNVEIVD